MADISRLRTESDRLRLFVQFCTYCKLPPEAYHDLSQQWHAGETGFGPLNDDGSFVIRFKDHYQSVHFEGTVIGEIMRKSKRLFEYMTPKGFYSGIPTKEFRSKLRIALRMYISHMCYTDGTPPIVDRIIRWYYTTKNDRGSINLWKRLVANGHTFLEAATVFGLMEFSSSAYEQNATHDENFDEQFTLHTINQTVHDMMWPCAMNDYERIMGFNRCDETGNDNINVTKDTVDYIDDGDVVDDIRPEKKQRISFSSSFSSLSDPSLST